MRGHPSRTGGRDGPPNIGKTACADAREQGVKTPHRAMARIARTDQGVFRGGASDKIQLAISRASDGLTWGCAAIESLPQR